MEQQKKSPASIQCVNCVVWAELLSVRILGTDWVVNEMVATESQSRGEKHGATHMVFRVWDKASQQIAAVFVRAAAGSWLKLAEASLGKLDE